LDAAKLKELIEDPRVLGLGEVMNVPAVLFGQDDMLQKLDLFKDKIIDGHGPDLLGKDLMAYRLAGIDTDHECSTFEEALERIRIGMYVQIRKGSAANNLAPIVKGLIAHNTPLDRCVFCTDDKHLEHILKDGHINSNVRESIALGIDPIDALCMASYYPAKLYGLKKMGALAPGYKANLIVFDDLQTIEPLHVMVNGVFVSKDKTLMIEDKTSYKRYTTDAKIMRTVKAPLTKEEDFTISLQKNKAHVIGLVDGQILTHKLVEEVPTKEGKFIPNQTYSKIAVVERYTGKKQIGLGILKGFGIKNGAIAQTIAHDSHNIVCVGDQDQDMTLAVNTLIEKQGGIVLVQEGVVVASLSLPIGGLMSTLTASQVTKELDDLLKRAYALDINPGIDPFLTLAFMALPVIPSLKITDQGLFDVGAFKHIAIEPS
jgi:adenine deaminase